MTEKYNKTTEGKGYISGDFDCWCIHAVPFDEWRKTCGRDDDIYPSHFFPEEVNKLDEPYVKYKITVEVIIVDES